MRKSFVCALALRAGLGFADRDDHCVCALLDEDSSALARWAVDSHPALRSHVWPRLGEIDFVSRKTRCDSTDKLVLAEAGAST